MPKILGNSLSEHRERTRTALFTALGELLREQSFDKITLSDVAARAQVGRTAVYNHFADKEDLLLGFVDNETRRYIIQLNAALAKVDNPVEQLRIYVRAQALLKYHYHFPMGSRLSELVSHDNIGRLHAHVNLLEQSLQDILSQAIDSGQIPPQNLCTTVRLIHATVLGGQPETSDAHDYEEYLQALDTYVLRAVGAPAATRPVQSDISFMSAAPTETPKRLPVTRCPVAH